MGRCPVRLVLPLHAPPHPRLDPTTLGVVGSFHGGDDEDATGAKIAVLDLDGDGASEVGVSAPNEGTSQYQGVIYLLSGVPVGDPEITSEATLSFHSYPAERLGMGLMLRSLDGIAVQLVAGGMGVVYGVDPTLRGDLGPESAAWRITGDFGFGAAVIGWDGDGDGIDDLVTQGETDTVLRFASPLSAATSEDSDTTWTTTGPEPDFWPLASLGDVTGDGTPDPGIGDDTYWSTLERVGAAYVVEGGHVESIDATAIALQVQGSEVGEAIGASMASGDLDGDGQLDLVVGGNGIFPDYHPGEVVGYLGPITSLDLAGAAFVIYGTELGASFGLTTALADADADGRAELYVGAWDEEFGLGALYLFFNDTLLL